MIAQNTQPGMRIKTKRHEGTIHHIARGVGTGAVAIYYTDGWVEGLPSATRVQVIG